MALLSPYTLIRAISLLHLTAAYLFLTAPRTLADQNVVFILGESMRIDHATSLDKPSEASAFIAALLAFLGVIDLAAAAMNENAALEYWLANVPVRLTFFFGLTGYVYLFKPGGLLGSAALATGGGGGGVGEPLQNSLVFTFGFAEIAAWFWIFTSLREERAEAVRRRVEEIKAGQDRL